MQKITGPIIDRVEFVFGMKSQGDFEASAEVPSEELCSFVKAARDRQRRR